MALAILWMSGSLVSFSMSAVAVRSLSATLRLSEILTFRTAVGLVILCAAALLDPRLRSRFRPGNLRLQLVRNGLHLGSQYAWMHGLAVLPLATVFALEFTAPVWLALLAVPLLGERLTPRRAGAIGLGLAGVLIVLRPAQGLDPASLFVLGAAIGFALVAIATKALTRTVSTFSILFWMNLIQLAMTSLGTDPFFPIRMDAWQWGAAMAFAVSGLTAHLCLTQAYRHGDAIVVMPLDFLRIPLIAVVGWLLYGERLDPFVFLGALVIVAGIALNLAGEARAAVSPSRTPGSGPAS